MARKGKRPGSQPNQRNINGSTANTSSSNRSIAKTNDDIEKQLRLQREKKKQSVVSASSLKATGDDDDDEENTTHMTVHDHNNKTLGGYVYDPVKKSYFPEKYYNEEMRRVAKLKLEHQQKDFEADSDDSSNSRNDPDVETACARYRQKKRKMQRLPLQQKQQPTMLSLMEMASQCPSSVKRHRIVARWGSRILLDSFRVAYIPLSVMQNRCLTTNWSLHFQHQEQRNISQHHHPPLVLNSAPWIRNFDVAPSLFDDDEKTPLLPQWIQSTRLAQRQKFATYHLKLLQQQNSRSHNNNTIPTRVVCLCMKEGRSVFFLQTYNTNTTGYNNNNNNNDTAGTGMYPIHFQKELNDFDILYKHDCIVFAGNTSKWFSYNFTLDRMMSSYNPSSDNDITTKSNVLCIATDDSLVMPDIVFAGHRDGGITIHDYRTKKVTGAMLSCNSRKSEHEFGSVVAMQLLFDQRPEQLLVRGSNGTYCRLFDIRCLGSLPSASPFTKNTRACAFEFCLPSTVLQEHTLSMTKGFATNPLRSTVMIPYFDSSNQNPSFGLWSLDSGEFIGNKPVKCWNSKQTDIMEPLSATTIKPLECLELCSKLTRAYAWSAPSGEKPDEDTEKRVRTIPGCFGLWLDWGLNGVHHVVCHGRL